MKTIYLFIIILAFSMPSQYAFACGEGGGEGSSGSSNVADNRSKVPYKFLKRPYKGNQNTRSGPLLGIAKPGLVDKHFQKAIAYMNKHSTQTPKIKKTNKNIDEIIAYMRMRALLSPNPNSLKALDKDISRSGKKAVAAYFVFSIMLGF
ncbi:MAG: hypothetical protein KAR45_21830 [Desulfobacteraceae bacterium]|nr:hypothetical protein [Desulfobacteraceae bacterium]